MRKRITVISETETGRNVKFKDNYTGKSMILNQFVKQIENDNYKNYHIRNINGMKTPASNPDKNINNNLG